MAAYDFSAPRLFLDHPLAGDCRIPLDKTQQNYVVNVLRLSEGSHVLIFNGRDGEWRARLVKDGPKRAALLAEGLVRPQTAAGDLHYLFAPLKHARLDYMVQKAVEMGADLLQPVLTRRTQVTRINLDRMRANAIEAAEQCGLLTLPRIAEPQTFETMITTWDDKRLLVFCDEDAEGDPLSSLAARADPTEPPPPLAVLIGPEGGFDPQERNQLLERRGVLRLSLGPRILRADTAAVAALSLVQAVLGDWRRS
jgi:16S rRNA (uracil1498-N3)-methyltransferase